MKFFGKERAGGSAPDQSGKPEVRAVMGAAKPSEDPFVSVVAYYIDGKDPIEAVTAKLEQQYAKTPDVVGGLITRITAGREEKQQRSAGA